MTASSDSFTTTLAIYHDVSVFSLNFCSAGRGPFIAGKAKKMCERRTFLGGGGSAVRDMSATSL